MRRISYQRTKMVSDQESETLLVQKDMDEADDLDQAILELRDRVNRQLGISESVKELRNDQVLLEQQNAHIEANISAATERWNKIQQFMEKLGVKLKDVAFVDDIPF